MKAILVIEFENKMKELVHILVENDYEVTVKRIGEYCQHKYQVEVSKDESTVGIEKFNRIIKKREEN